ncbi:hypothetical protein ABIE40_004748 [Rhizobium sp. OAE497]
MILPEDAISRASVVQIHVAYAWISLATLRRG